jgi:hypothetical protein
MPSCAGSWSQTYELKTIADYGIGPDAHISAASVRQAVDVATHFVAAVAALLE